MHLKGRWYDPFETEIGRFQKASGELQNKNKKECFYEKAVSLMF